MSASFDDAPVSLADLLNEPPMRADWGPWRLDAAHTALIYIEGAGYEYAVTLDTCVSPAAVLDWIYQIQSKTWADDRTIAGFVRALDDVLDPQNTLCSWGQDDMRITADAITRRVAEVATWPSR